MRFFGLFSVVSFVLLSTVTALPISTRSVGSSTTTLNWSRQREQEISRIVARVREPEEKFVQKVTFHTDPSNPYSAGVVLDGLALTPGNYKIVRDYHVGLVREAMNQVPDARRAEIMYLAHARGSMDPNVHVTAIFKDKSNRIIQGARLGNPNTMSDNRHIYTNPDKISDGLSTLPQAYKDAVRAYQIKKFGRFLGI